MYVLLLISSIGLNFIAGNLIGKQEKKKKKKLYLVVGIVLNLLILSYYKYIPFIINQFFSADCSEFTSVCNLHLPLGISFFTFQAISYLFDTYRDRNSAQTSVIKLGLYISLFPQLIAGPIVRYCDIQKHLSRRKIEHSDLFIGAERFITGLAKKMIIANPLGLMTDTMFATPTNELYTGEIWLGAVLFLFQIYFDFSAYSDMAIGIGRMLGFKIPENFNYPYMAANVQEFWRRWHISLSTWFRDYLYIPLGGNRCSTVRVYLNLVVVFVLCGLWHGANWTFVVWGAYHGLFLLLERGWFGYVLKSLWWPLRHAYLLIVVLTGWVIFRAENLNHAFDLLSIMYFGSQSITPVELTYRFMSFEGFSTLLLAFIVSVPTFKLMKRGVLLHPEKCVATTSHFMHKVILLAYMMFLLVLLVCSMAYVSSSTFQPFIYFQF